MSILQLTKEEYIKSVTTAYQESKEGKMKI